MQEVEESKIK